MKTITGSKKEVIRILNEAFPLKERKNGEYRLGDNYAVNEMSWEKQINAFTKNEGKVYNFTVKCLGDTKYSNGDILPANELELVLYSHDVKIV